MKRWVEQWARVGPILEQERWDSLAAMTDEEALASRMAHPRRRGTSVAPEGVHASPNASPVMTPSIPLATAARDVLAVLNEADLRGCLIGGLVLPRWGQPRATTDADFSVLAPYGEEAAVLDTLLRHFAPRRPDARAFALQHRVLLLQSAAGVGIDVALAAFPFEIDAIARATPWELVPGIVVRTCGAEDLVVYKLVAGRPQDLLDMETIVRRQGRRLDASLVRQWGQVLAELKEDPDLLRPFEDALAKVKP
jgi:hypothetical protein